MRDLGFDLGVFSQFGCKITNKERDGQSFSPISRLQMFLDMSMQRIVLGNWEWPHRADEGHLSEDWRKAVIGRYRWDYPLCLVPMRASTTLTT